VIFGGDSPLLQIGSRIYAPLSRVYLFAADVLQRMVGAGALETIAVPSPSFTPIRSSHMRPLCSDVKARSLAGAGYCVQLKPHICNANALDQFPTFARLHNVCTTVIIMLTSISITDNHLKAGC